MTMSIQPIQQNRATKMYSTRYYCKNTSRTMLFFSFVVVAVFLLSFDSCCYYCCHAQQQSQFVVTFQQLTDRLHGSSLLSQPNGTPANITTTLFGGDGEGGGIMNNLFNTSTFQFVAMEQPSDFVNSGSSSFLRNKRLFQKRTMNLRTKYQKIASTISSNGDIVWDGILVDNDDDDSKLLSRLRQQRSGFATILQTADGTIAGSFSTDYASYSLVQLPDKSYEVRISKWNDYIDEPEEAEETETEEDALYQTESSNTSSSILVRDDKYKIIQVPDGVIEPKNNWIVSIDKFIQDDAIFQPINNTNDRRQRQLRSNHHDRQLQTSDVTVDLLVGVTNRAMCEFAKLNYGCPYTTANALPITNEINLRIRQTNNAFRTMNIKMTIRLVKLVFLSFGYDPIPNEALLNSIRQDVNYIKWRKDAKADLVHFITGGELNSCGLAGMRSFESASSYKCLPYYSFTHELGHSFGCDHNRANSIPNKSNLYGYGWQRNVLGSAFRTVMSYSCSSTYCPRIPFFSTKEYTYKKLPMGDTNNDNVRVLRENAVRVSNYMV